MSMKHLLKTRTYRERSQPASRQALGLLEKKKDYTLRARDFHRKEDAIKSLREKALFKNPDEYYFKMAHTKMKDGVHRKAEAKQPSADELRAFKKEDASYLYMKQTSEAKKIERLRASLHRLDEPLQNRRTVFVSSDKGARELDEAGQLGTTPAEVAAAPPLRSMQRSKRARAALELGASANPTSSSAADEGEAADNEASEQPSATASATVAPPKLSKKLRAKLDRAKAATYSELEQRVERHKQMGRTLHRIGIEKALLGKGPRRKLKSKEEGAPKQYKFKQRRKK